MHMPTPDRWRDKYFPEEKPVAPVKKPVKKPVAKPIKQPKPPKPVPDYTALISAYTASRDEQKRTADAQYSRNIEELKSAFDASSQKTTNEKDLAAKAQNMSSDERLRGLYIDKELAHRNMAVQLSAKGIGGGGGAVSAAEIDRAYNSKRQAAQSERQSALDGIQKSSDELLARQKASYEKERETLEGAFSKALANLESEYARLLAKLK